MSSVVYMSERRRKRGSWKGKREGELRTYECPHIQRAHFLSKWLAMYCLSFTLVGWCCCEIVNHIGSSVLIITCSQTCFLVNYANFHLFLLLNVDFILSTYRKQAIMFSFLCYQTVILV